MVLDNKCQVWKPQERGLKNFARRFSVSQFFGMAVISIELFDRAGDRSRCGSQGFTLHPENIAGVQEFVLYNATSLA
jgi:hypothetical protein